MCIIFGRSRDFFKRLFGGHLWLFPWQQVSKTTYNYTFLNLHGKVFQMTLNAKSWFDKEKKSICTTISPLKKQKILFSSPFILSHSFKCIRKKSGKLRRQTVIKGLREIKLKDSWSKSQLPVHSPSYASPWAEHLLYTFFFTYDTTSLKLCRRWCKLASQCDPCCIMKQNQAV